MTRIRVTSRTDRWLGPGGLRRCLLWMAAALAASTVGCGGAVPPSSAGTISGALAAYRAGRDEEAVRLSSRFIAMHPTAQEAGEAHYIRGLARQRTGDTAGGEQDFRQALDLTRRSDLAGRVHLALAELAQERDDPIEAEASYLAALAALEPTDTPAERVLFRLATLLQRRGDWLEADRYFDRLGFLFSDGPYAAAASRRIRARYWTLQVGLLDRRDSARALQEQLRRAGWEARIAPVGAATVRLAVQVGRHPSYQEAATASERLRPHVDALAIVTARP